MVRACPSVTCAVTVYRHYKILSKADVDVRQAIKYQTIGNLLRNCDGDAMDNVD